jgi:hypothetical protein
LVRDGPTLIGEVVDGNDGRDVVGHVDGERSDVVVEHLEGAKYFFQEFVNEQLRLLQRLEIASPTKMLASEEPALTEFACSECNRSLANLVLSYISMIYCSDCCPQGKVCNVQFRFYDLEELNNLCK